LESVKEAIGEPGGYWLPESIRKTSEGSYAQGVEVPAKWKGQVPAGFDLLTLPAATMLVFQGEPYDESEINIAIGALWHRIESFNPEVYGYRWDATQPRVQVAPQGWRGYIEMRPVLKIT
jgi:hypothetical protein